MLWRVVGTTPATMASCASVASFSAHSRTTQDGLSRFVFAQARFSHAAIGRSSIGSASEDDDSLKTLIFKSLSLQQSEFGRRLKCCSHDLTASATNSGWSYRCTSDALVMATKTHLSAASACQPKIVGIVPSINFSVSLAFPGQLALYSIDLKTRQAIDRSMNVGNKPTGQSLNRRAIAAVVFDGWTSESTGFLRPKLD